MSRYWQVLMVLGALAAFSLFARVHAQGASPCGAPTPGSPHVCVTWVASVTPPAITGYNLYRSTTAGAENFGTPLNTTLIPATQTFFYDTTDVIGTQYFYKAVAVGTGGVLSQPSPEVSAQVPVPPNSPTTPSAAID